VSVPLPPSPQRLRERAARLEGVLEAARANREVRQQRVEALQAYLALSEPVEQALDELSKLLFGRLSELLEKNLTAALQEVLEQPLQLRVTREFSRGRAQISFHIEREGNAEDILRAQGGSVANVLSVGLRFFALKTLDEQVHRRFVLLDEQDCWLRPDLVPRLARIVHQAAHTLGFQVLMISHHDLGYFRNYADRIYEFIPSAEGIKVKLEGKGHRAKEMADQET